MKRKFTAFLAAFLCAALLCGCAPKDTPDALEEDPSVEIEDVFDEADPIPDTEEKEPLPEGEPPETDILEPEISPERARAMELLSQMTQEEKIYQLFIVTQDQLTGETPVTVSGGKTREAIENYPVGGIIYFSDNLVSREQCIAMIENIQSYSKLGLFIAVDEEGGLVSRLGRNPAMGTTKFPAMLEIGSEGDAMRAYDVGFTIGSEISALGFNLDFAPVADVFSNPENMVIGTRAFSDDPEAAAEMVRECVKGLADSGMLCTLKHFPGHGDTAEDSHFGKARITKTLDELYECELVPFIAGIEAGAPFVMAGHLTLPQVIDENIPATLSYDIITGVLRQQLGFEGIVITDSMAMGAITELYSPGEAAVMAIKAGVDIILMPQDLGAAAEGILSAVESGELSEERINESVLRILETKILSGIIE